MKALIVLIHFYHLKQNVKEQVDRLGKSNKTVYSFLRDKRKILPTKLQQKWGEILQLSSDNIDYENNFY